MELFVICVLIVLAFFASDSANKRRREKELQKVKADVASAFRYTCRMLETLDILEDVLKPYGDRLYFYRAIGPNLRKTDTLFELKCIILRSRRYPLVQNAVDSIVREQELRYDAKMSGEPLSSFENYTVWRDATDEQLARLHDITTVFDQRRTEANDIMLETSLLLRFDNPLSYDAYCYKVNMYVRALAEAIHKKFPAYGFEADTYGIHFNDKNGVVSYKGI